MDDCYFKILITSLYLVGAFRFAQITANEIFLDKFITLLLGLLCIYFGMTYYKYTKKEDENAEKLSESVYKWLKRNIKNKEDITKIIEKIILQDYITLNDEIERRENITLVIGSIFIGASFLVLGQSINEKQSVLSIPALFSVILYTIWAFALHHTTRKYDSFSYARLKAIERFMGENYNYFIGTHHFLNARRKGYDLFKMLEGDVFSYYDLSKIEQRPEKWTEIRTAFWSFPYILLGISWILIALVEIFKI